MICIHSVFFHPRLNIRRLVQRGYDGLGNTLLPESLVLLPRHALSRKRIDEKREQSWPETSLVPGVWQERQHALWDGILGFERRTGDFRNGDPSLGGGTFPA
jgi:hypothetical protein